MLLSAIAAIAFAADVKLAEPKPTLHKVADAVIIIKPDNDRRRNWDRERRWHNERRHRKPDVHVHQPKPPWWYWLGKTLTD